MPNYILQKDLPNAKAGSVYRLTDNGEDYVCYDLLGKESWDISYPKKYVENNPEWFKKEETHNWSANYVMGKVWTGEPNVIINGEQFIPISEAVLRKYTEEDMRKCFYAPIHVDGGGRYDTFEDYLKTLK